MSDLEVKRGRPPHEPTDKLRRRVSIAAAAGMRHEDIATGLGIARNTLDKHYEFELSVGAWERRMEVIEAVHEQALKGNAAAAKTFTQLVPVVAAPPADPLPEGIKAQRDLAAKTAQEGTEWKRLGIQ